jgi:putative resolvase
MIFFLSITYLKIVYVFSIMKMNNYVPLREIVKLLGLQPHTIRKWGKEGLVDTIKTPTGQQLYSKNSIQAILNGNPDDKKTLPPKKQNIIYCRVSSKKQEEDLIRQIGQLRELYPNHTLVEDIGSGTHWKRKGLQTILELAMQKRIGDLVVAHRDRLCRFGFELIEHIVKLGGGKLIVLDDHQQRSSEQELAEDILSIIHVYSCRHMGKRRYKNSHPQNKTLSDSKTATDIEEMDRNL